ncbi:MAG: TetR/AcrR family transcriptional regulator [Clostridia bacterium]|nr:TetR/AcrR family transcriptional regulator [Clostridia bacterium]
MDIPDLSGLGLAEKEQKILESAIHVFSEKGFSAATTSEIAKNAGVAEGTIFRYFKTKKDILRGILVQTINIMSGKVVIEAVEKILNDSEGKELRVVLKEFIHDRIKLVDHIFPMARVIITEALFHEDVREAIYQNIIARVMITIRRFHKQMVERGLIRSDIEPELLIKTILGNLVVLIAQRKLFGDKFELDDIDKEVDKIIDVILYGIAGDKE